MEEHQRLGRTCPFQPGHDDRTARSRLEAFGLDTFASEDTDQEIGGFGDIAGRDGRVDADVALERLQRFRVYGSPVGGLRGESCLKGESDEENARTSHPCS